MQITIGEDNGFLYGGVPTLVVVSVSFDDGRCVRFPYPADKPISALYEDLKVVTPKDIPVRSSLPVESAKVSKPISVRPSTAITTPIEGDPNRIENGDFVTCVKVEDRGQGATVDIHVGGEYRVVKVHEKDLTVGAGQSKHVIDGYDVVDDSAPTQFRTFVQPHEVVLSRKHEPKTTRGPMLMEEIVDCPTCGEKVASVVKDNAYEGDCEKCGHFVKPKEAKRDPSDPAAKGA